MDGVNFKKLLSACGFIFGARNFFPIIFIVEKCVHFVNWNVDLAENLKFLKKLYTFFHHKNDGGKCLTPKMKPYILLAL